MANTTGKKRARKSLGFTHKKRRRAPKTGSTSLTQAEQSSHRPSPQSSPQSSPEPSHHSSISVSGSEEASIIQQLESRNSPVPSRFDEEDEAYQAACILFQLSKGGYSSPGDLVGWCEICCPICRQLAGSSRLPGCQLPGSCYPPQLDSQFLPQGEFFYPSAHTEIPSAGRNTNGADFVHNYPSYPRHNYPSRSSSPTSGRNSAPPYSRPYQHLPPLLQHREAGSGSNSTEALPASTPSLTRSNSPGQHSGNGLLYSAAFADPERDLEGTISNPGTDDGAQE
ncbi:hypothetical protein BGZ61DRAFT_514430 [Ilyonectria robusta]|uniref:uncharacterized protein n=1 Tax=Ilyonectria robusta TaxID=1079257 RepID=UPI001E8D5AC8|nr:uncharacterized protein BGZ61DRAFT_514430 [Ilyonectria robusta]KAH8735128.1 hypothetical protein BGZ61DRAFT_514430 [Ilyonectria robusta]